MEFPDISRLRTVKKVSKRSTFLLNLLHALSQVHPAFFFTRTPLDVMDSVGQISTHRWHPTHFAGSSTGLRSAPGVIA